MFINSVGYNTQYTQSKNSKNVKFGNNITDEQKKEVEYYIKESTDNAYYLNKGYNTFRDCTRMTKNNTKAIIALANALDIPVDLSDSQNAALDTTVEIRKS